MKDDIYAGVKIRVVNERFLHSWLYWVSKLKWFWDIEEWALMIFTSFFATRFSFSVGKLPSSGFFVFIEFLIYNNLAVYFGFIRCNYFDQLEKCIHCLKNCEGLPNFTTTTTTIQWIFKTLFPSSYCGFNLIFSKFSHDCRCIISF